MPAKKKPPTKQQPRPRRLKPTEPPPQTDEAIAAEAEKIQMEINVDLFWEEDLRERAAMAADEDTLSSFRDAVNRLWDKFPDTIAGFPAHKVAFLQKNSQNIWRVSQPEGGTTVIPKLPYKPVATTGEFQDLGPRDEGEAALASAKTASSGLPPLTPSPALHTIPLPNETATTATTARTAGPSRASRTPAPTTATAATTTTTTPAPEPSPSSSEAEAEPRYNFRGGARGGNKGKAVERGSGGSGGSRPALSKASSKSSLKRRRHEHESDSSHETEEDDGDAGDSEAEEEEEDGGPDFPIRMKGT
ncbi:hypothetical protein CALVIDRAFT_567981, partial [Calocera viscosa TUFC12733]